MKSLLILLISILAVSAQLFLSKTSAEGQALEKISQTTVRFSWFYSGGWGVGDNVCQWMGVTCARVGTSVRVVELNLARNNLKGFLPPEIGAFTHLQKLLLHKNKLGGGIPPQISSLVNLELLFLQENDFTGPIPNLSALSKLRFLYLEGNKLTGPIPSWSFSFVQAIDLSDNMLTGTIPDMFASMPNLNDFRASNNMLSGILPKSLFRSTSSVSSLQLSNNQLTGLIPEIPPKMKILFLENNALGCFPPATVGVDLKINGNKFICSPQTSAVGPDLSCVSPVVSDFYVKGMPGVKSVPSTEVPTLELVLDGSGVTLQDCPDVYCYLGNSFQVGAKATYLPTANPAAPKVECVVAAPGQGRFSVTLQTASGTLISKLSNGASLFTFTAQCETADALSGECGSLLAEPQGPAGQCGDDGCICNAQKGWAGTACNQRACPGPNCSQRGVCDPNTGICSCNEGWTGNGCQIEQKVCQPACQNGGVCTADGTCSCAVDVDQVTGKVTRYSGEDCSQILCEGASVDPVTMQEIQCNGHGTCNTATGLCQCTDNFQSPESGCATKQCTQRCGVVITTNSGNQELTGYCDERIGECKCKIQWTNAINTADQSQCQGLGHDCLCRRCLTADPKDSTEICSGHGQCQYQQVAGTTPFYTGTCQCDVYQTPAGQTVAGAVWREPRCDVPDLPCPMFQGEECGGRTRGSCEAPLDLTSTQGRCVCRDNTEAYMGPACETRTCPKAYSNCNPVVEREAETLVFNSTDIRGVCRNDGSGTCQCNYPFTGEFCHLYECPSYDAGGQCGLDLGRGICEFATGRCKCEPDLATGRKLSWKTACQFPECPGSDDVTDCSGSGRCEQGECVCEPGYDGSGCEQSVANPAHLAGGIIGALLCVMLCSVGVFCFLRQKAIAKLQRS